MKRILLAACAIVALATPAMASECVSTANAGEAVVPVYAAPSSHAAIRRWIHKDGILRAYKGAAEWSRVRGGWVESKYIGECR